MCCRTTKLLCCNHRAHVLWSLVATREKPTHLFSKGPPCCNWDPTQPKINKYCFLKVKHYPTFAITCSDIVFSDHYFLLLHCNHSIFPTSLGPLIHWLLLCFSLWTLISLSLFLSLPTSEPVIQNVNDFLTLVLNSRARISFYCIFLSGVPLPEWFQLFDFLVLLNATGKNFYTTWNLVLN